MTPAAHPAAAAVTAPAADPAHPSTTRRAAVARRAAIAAAALLALGAAGAAWAQNPPPRPVRPTDQMPLILHVPAAPQPSQHPMPPLTDAQRARLRQAQDLNVSGNPEQALPLLKGLMNEVPHHPLILTQWARAQNMLEDFAAVERTARAERLAQKDSLLLGAELAEALERQGRPRDAAQIAIEAWVASPLEPEWARDVLVRAEDVVPRDVREMLRRANLRYPERLDLARGCARIEWKLGDLRAALKTLATAERSEARPRMRFTFAEELMLQATTRDSTGAIETWLDLAADTRYDASYRTASARRAWDVITARDDEREFAPRLQKALADLPTKSLSAELRLGLARGLREAGRTAEARALLEPEGGREDLPEFAAERALADLRDGPPARALPGLRAAADRSPEQSFRYAEALFYAGQTDSAHTWYEKVTTDPRGPYTGAALERLYLLEESGAKAALPVFGRIAYEEWRGETRRATALTDSLFRALPRGSLWAQAALMLAAQRSAAGDAAGALEPLLAVADSLPDDRLAPVARDHAGDIYVRLKDDSRAAAQYEECLSRYPKSWNAPEVRRKLEALRRDKRF
jgi:tetratricopeptide (TPR) repeat protein